MFGIIVFFYAELLSRIVVVARAIPFKENWKLLGFRLLDCELHGVVNLFTCADAFEWLRGVWVDEAIKQAAEGLVVI